MASINPLYKPSKKKSRSKDDYIKGIRSHNKFVLSELITLMESDSFAKKEVALQVLDILKEEQSNVSLRIGVTGSPGVGKSTFINAYAYHLAQLGKRVAILAIDPTSQPTKGSILGDKTRMDQLTGHPQIFIRPSPAGEMLGGIAKGTWEAIELCEAAGYDYILVETVGVGQSEHLVAQMVDVMVLLLQVAAGDDLQGIKRGIIEMADLFVINKDDGPHKPLVAQAKSYYNQALTFFDRTYPVQYDRVLTCSAEEHSGIEAIHKNILILEEYLMEHDHLRQKRLLQKRHWFAIMMKDHILNTVITHDIFKKYDQALSISEGYDYFALFEQFKKEFEGYFPS